MSYIFPHPNSPHPLVKNSLQPIPLLLFLAKIWYSRTFSEHDVSQSGQVYCDGRNFFCNILYFLLRCFHTPGPFPLPISTHNAANSFWKADHELHYEQSRVFFLPDNEFIILGVFDWFFLHYFLGCLCILWKYFFFSSNCLIFSSNCLIYKMCADSYIFPYSTLFIPLVCYIFVCWPTQQFQATVLREF